jgi:hypothetical protein
VSSVEISFMRSCTSFRRRWLKDQHGLRVYIIEQCGPRQAKQAPGKVQIANRTACIHEQCCECDQHNCVALDGQQGDEYHRQNDQGGQRHDEVMVAGLSLVEGCRVYSE